MQSAWHPIPSHPNHEILDDGSAVRRIDPATGREKRLHFNGPFVGDPYIRVWFTEDGRRFNRLLHQLVLETFHGPRPEGMRCSRHLDGDALNNHPNNLAWGTDQQNHEDRVRHGRPTGGAAPRRKSLAPA